MKTLRLIGVFAAPLLMMALTQSGVADSICQDGTTSKATGRGACSSHGGVKEPSKDAAAGAAAPAAPPAGATAKCKDGTYSTAKNHSGACSKHRGVADWLAPSK